VQVSQPTGGALPPEQIVATFLIPGTFLRDVTVVRRVEGGAVIRIDGMTGDFAYGTLKYGANNPAVHRRLQLAADASIKVFVCNGDGFSAGPPPEPSDHILVFILLTAANELVVAGPDRCSDWVPVLQDNTYLFSRRMLLRGFRSGQPNGPLPSVSGTTGMPKGFIVVSSTGRPDPERFSPGIEKTFFD
jgi:hypothetical protein